MQSFKETTPLYVDNIIIVNQYSGGLSSLRKNRMKIFQEYRKIQLELGLPITINWMLNYIKSLIWVCLFSFISFKNIFKIKF
jgi:hypothetical protein